MDKKMQDYDFSQMPTVSDHVFTAKLQKPEYLKDDWIEPKQREYTSKEHNIWDQLYRR